MTLEGNPWFVAKDVCDILFNRGAVHTKGTSQYALYLDEDEKRLIPRATLATLGLIKGTAGGGGKGSLGFSESGLYRLIMRSDKPQARPFQDWVTREVLPSIRKTGAYELPKGEVMPLPDKALLTLVTREFQGQPMWAVDHPEHGELLMAKHVLQALGYDAHQLKTIGASPVLVRLGIGAEERILVPFAILANGHGTNYPRRGASFLSPLTVRKIVLASTKPKAQEFREWLADVSIKIEDTGGYLLNEAARETAFADTRTTVPLPAEIAGGYAALIEARKAEMAARETAFAEEKRDSSAAERMNIRLCPPRRPHRKRPTFCVSHAPISPLRWPPWPPHTPLCPTRSALRCSL